MRQYHLEKMRLTLPSGKLRHKLTENQETVLEAKMRENIRRVLMIKRIPRYKSVAHFKDIILDNKPNEEEKYKNP